MEKALKLLLCLVLMTGCSSTTAQKSQYNSSEIKGFTTEYQNFNGYPGFRLIRASTPIQDTFPAKNNVSDETRTNDEIRLLVAQTKIHTKQNLSQSVNKAEISKASLNPTYMIKKGETLLTVANNLQFSKKNYTRAVVAMWINNMEKFVEGNINGVYQGMVLDLSGLDDRVQQMDTKTAEKIIRKQKVQWKRYIERNPSNNVLTKVLSVGPAEKKPSDTTIKVAKNTVESGSKAGNTVKKSTPVTDSNLKQKKWKLVSGISKPPTIPSYADKSTAKKQVMDMMHMDKIYERVLPGDNLFKIADRLGYLDALKIKAAAVIWQDNKNRFAGDNMNNLKPGTYLDITNLSISVSKMDFNTAENILIDHGEEWPQEKIQTPAITRVAKVAPAPVKNSSKEIRKVSKEIHPRLPQSVPVASLEKKEVFKTIAKAIKSDSKVAVASLDKMEDSKIFEKILEGDTLFKIVSRLGYSENDEMKAAVALWNLNKPVFINSNMNGMPAGEKLDVGALSAEMNKLDYLSAKKIVKAQWREWTGNPVFNNPVVAAVSTEQKATEIKIAKSQPEEVKPSEAKMENKKPILEEAVQVAKLPEMVKPQMDKSESIKSESVNDILTKPESVKKELAPEDSQEPAGNKLTFETWKNSIKGIVTNFKSKILNIKTTVTDKVPDVYTKASAILEDMQLSKSNEKNDKVEVNFN